MRCSESFTELAQVFPAGCVQVVVDVEWQNYPMFEASEVSVGFWTHNSWKQPHTSEYPCSFHV